jgi:serine/threonine protein kinase
MGPGRTLNIERILNEVERERRKNLVLRLVDEGLNYEPNSDRYYFVRQRTALAFDVLTCVMPDKAADIIKGDMGKNFQDHRANLILASLPLALLRPNKAIELYENALDDWLETIRMQAAQALPLLIISRPEDAARLYKKALEPEGYEFERAKVFMAAAGSLSGIAGFYASCENPPRALEENPKFMELIGMDQRTKSAMEAISAFYKCLAEDNSEIVENEKQVVNGIRKIVSSKQTLVFESIKEKELKNVNITNMELENILGNTEFNAHMFLAEAFNTRNIWEEQQEKLPLDITEIKDITRDKPLKKDTEITERTTLKSLMMTSPERLLEFYNDNIRNSNKVMNDKVKHALRCIIATMADDNLTPIEDEEYEFARRYLNSKYTKTKKEEYRSEKEVLAELKKLCSDNNRNYEKMLKILECGDAENLAEIVEFSEIDIPKYTIIGKISEVGGSSVVYMALDERIQGNKQIVALKLMRFEEEIGDKLKKHQERGASNLKKMFLKDIENLEKLNHQNIAKILGKGEYKDQVYIVQQYYEHGSLEDHLQDVDPIETFEKILEGLSYIHLKNITHRDLKPGNIFLTGDENIAVIGDLQTCRTVEELQTKTDEEKVQRGYGYTHGTTHSAPEVLIRHKANQSSDVYSMGLIFWRMLTGKELPFEYSTEYFESIPKDKHEETHEKNMKNLLEQVDDTVSAEIKGLLESCLGFDWPHRRFPAVFPLYDLKRIRKGEPLKRSQDPEKRLDVELNRLKSNDPEAYEALKKKFKE